MQSRRLRQPLAVKIEANRSVTRDAFAGRSRTRSRIASLTILQRRPNRDPTSRLARVHRELIISLAARHHLPAIYAFRLFVADGGLISYGPDAIDPYRRAAGYVDRILKGQKPADLPVQAPVKYEITINFSRGLLRRIRPGHTAIAARACRRGDRVGGGQIAAARRRPAPGYPRMVVFGASDPLPSVAARVGSLNR